VNLQRKCSAKAPTLPFMDFCASRYTQHNLDTPAPPIDCCSPDKDGVHFCPRAMVRDYNRRFNCRQKPPSGLQNHSVSSSFPFRTFTSSSSFFLFFSRPCLLAFHSNVLRTACPYHRVLPTAQPSCWNNKHHNRPHLDRLQGHHSQHLLRMLVHSSPHQPYPRCGLLKTDQEPLQTHRSCRPSDRLTSPLFLLPSSQRALQLQQIRPYLHTILLHHHTACVTQSGILPVDPFRPSLRPRHQ
jgi:hypothetical protein